MATNISANQPSLEEMFVPRYHEKFEIRMSHFLKCVSISLGFQDIFLFYYCTVFDIVQLQYTCCITVNFCGCFTLHSTLYDCSRVGCNEIVIIHNSKVHYYCCCFIDFINVSLFS